MSNPGIGLYAPDGRRTPAGSAGTGDLPVERREKHGCEASAGDFRTTHSPTISVIVPTYREVGNIPELVERVRTVVRDHQLDLELLIIDDASDDGTDESVAELGEGDWLKLVSRTGRRSLSRAVMRGMELARGEILVVMDGDLSHPPEVIPQLVDALEDGSTDLVVGSRFVPGARIDGGWSPVRRLNSLAARFLARPLTDVADRTSGFFALGRATYLAADGLDPVGYKIGLELIVKTGGNRIREVPIHFRNRRHGTTKLGWRQRLEYLEHLRRLMAYRWKHRRQPTS